MSLRSRINAAAPLPARLARVAREELRAQRARPVRSELGFTLRGGGHQASGQFEQEEVSFILDRLPDCDVFVDIGANVGLYTCLARSRGVRALAIEPLPENLRYLYANLIDNAWTDTAVYPVALGQASGLLSLYGSGTGASFISGWAGARRETVVPVLTLDSILRGAEMLGKRLIIKVDVEGAERMVLSGARATLAAEPAPTWMVEVTLSEHHPAGRNPDFAALFDMFWSAGYSAESVHARREVTREDVTEWAAAGRSAFGGYNYAFTR
jgi:FkbM family methyltransferase